MAASRMPNVQLFGPYGRYADRPLGDGGHGMRMRGSAAPSALAGVLRQPATMAATNKSLASRQTFVRWRH